MSGIRQGGADVSFVEALKLAESVMEQYRLDKPKWWKRMDGTPILNDVSVRMAEAFLKEIERLRAEVERLTAERDDARHAALNFGDDLRLWSIDEIVSYLEQRAEACSNRDQCSTAPTELSYCATQKAVAELKAALAERVALLARVEAAERDAARYRWLTSDHNDPWVRQHCREILERMGVMSYSATSTAIDTALEIEQFHAIDAAMEGGK